MTSGTREEIGMNTDVSSTSNERPAEAPALTPSEPRLTRRTWMGLAIVGLVIVLVIIFGIAARSASEHSLEKETAVAAVPSVNVIYPAPSTLASEIALPGNTQAFVDTPIYSRTSGYLKKWYFDIGARVRKGQLMAEIETP